MLSGAASEFIRFSHLTKRYKGVPAPAVGDLSLSIRAGQTFGLVGSNGAGKSTTLKCLLGLSRPTAGLVTVCGERISRKWLAAVAYVPEVSALYDWLTFDHHVKIRSSEYLNFETARAFGLAERFDLPRRRKIRTLSKGQRQLAALALAIAQRPTCMVLDEPTSGLDPIAQWAVLDIIEESRAQGVTTILSSHNIAQVERVATNVGFMERGQLITFGTLDDVRRPGASLEDAYRACLGNGSARP